MKTLKSRMKWEAICMCEQKNTTTRRVFCSYHSLFLLVSEVRFALPIVLRIESKFDWSRTASPDWLIINSFIPNMRSVSDYLLKTSNQGKLHCLKCCDCSVCDQISICFNDSHCHSFNITRFSVESVQLYGVYAGYEHTFKSNGLETWCKLRKNR